MLKQRIATALVLAPLAIAAVLWLPPGGMALLAGAVFVLAFDEWVLLGGFRHPLARLAWGLLLAAILAGLWIEWRPALALGLVLVGCLWWLAAIFWLRNISFAAAPTRRNALLKTLAGFLVVVPAWAAALVLHGHMHHGLWLLVGLLIVWAADIGAYFAGSRFGRRKLAPRISPGKTWAGVGGGILLALVVALAAGLAFGFPAPLLGAFAGLTVVGVAISIVGDLTESLLKRHALVKDSGTIFPGHGGLFDRLDSVSAFLPVFALGTLLLAIPA